jgi:hypothetical protein
MTAESSMMGSAAGKFFEPRFDQGLAARVMGVVKAAQRFWPSFLE